jgi:hypothetical protein
MQTNFDMLMHANMAMLLSPGKAGQLTVNTRSKSARDPGLKKMAEADEMEVQHDSVLCPLLASIAQLSHEQHSSS